MIEKTRTTIDTFVYNFFRLLWNKELLINIIRRRIQLLIDLKEKREYWKLKEIEQDGKEKWGMMSHYLSL